MALVVFTGGARSGKSAAAQRLAQARAVDGARVVVAVFATEDGADPEMAHRIARHRADRPAGFETLEVVDPDTWLGEVADDALLVVDCLGTLVGLVMGDVWSAHTGDQLADAGTELPAGVEEGVERKVEHLVDALAARKGDTIVVTNEVGMSVVPEYASARVFRDVLGRANRCLVAEADAAYLVVAGRMIDLTAARREVAWPED